jgi:equilibrative nucleoside transporter 1/2/3
MAGKFPDKYMSAQMLGQAIGGVFPALVDICIVSIDVREEDVGAVCFAIATAVLIICLAALMWALRTPFFKHYYANEENVASSPTSSTPSPSTLTILKLSWVYLLSIFITFSVTLTVFPSVAVLIKSETSNSGSDWATKYFTAVSVFLLFNVGDLVGRGLASWIKMPRRSTLGKATVLIASLSRILFIPLFLYCNIDSDKPRTVIFKSDADFITFMALFAVSNGYIGNICMLHGPKSTPEKELQEGIALILIAGLVVGTGVGSFLSYPIVAAL